jgi:hypothetical protein
MEGVNMLDVLLNKPEEYDEWLYDAQSKFKHESRNGKTTLEELDVTPCVKKGLFTKDGGDKSDALVKFLDKKWGMKLDVGPRVVPVGNDKELEVPSEKLSVHFKAMAALCKESKDDATRLTDVKKYVAENDLNVDEVLAGTTTEAIVTSKLGINHVAALGEVFKLSESFQALLRWSKTESDDVKKLSKRLQEDGVQLYSPSSNQTLFHLTLPLMMVRKSLQVLLLNPVNISTTFIEALVEYCTLTGHVEAMLTHFINKESTTKTVKKRKKMGGQKTSRSPSPTSTTVDQKGTRVTPPMVEGKGYQFNEDDDSLTYSFDMKEMVKAR